jgi:hypothetical protein
MTSILSGHDVLTAGKLARKFGHYSFSTTRKVLCFGKLYAFFVLLVSVFMFPHSKICFFHKEGEFILPEGRFIKISQSRDCSAWFTYKHTNAFH